MPSSKRSPRTTSRLLRAAPFIVLFLFAFGVVLAASANQEKSAGTSGLVDSQCIKCHADYQGRDNLLAGTVIAHAGRSKSVLVQVGHERHAVTYTDDTRMFLDGRLEEHVPVTMTVNAVGNALTALEIRSMPPIFIPDEKYITGEELYPLVIAGPHRAGYALFDVRPSSRFAEGHIPTARPLPLDKMAELRDRLPENKDTLLIFYCGGEHCTLSMMAAQIAHDWGYENVRIYQDGNPDWLRRGNVLLSTQDFVHERMQKAVVLDLRGPDKAAQGHIPSAVAVDMADIRTLRDQFPADRRAYVILYAEEEGWEQLAPLVREIHSWGYHRISMLEGGFAAWRQAGLPVNITAASTRITYTHQPSPDEISREEFSRLLQDPAANALILDVRTPVEMSAGSLPQAMKIPLDELAVRINEIPPDREVVIHCATGMRAEIGHSILARAGMRSRFLNDTVDIVGNRVYLGTSITLDDADVGEGPLAGLDPSLVRIHVATTDAALSARMMRFGKVEFDRGRYAAAKAYFWRAILADPTSREAWRYYDMTVVYSLADTVQRFPAMLGAPDAPLADPDSPGQPGLPGGMQPASGRSDEGC